MADLFARRQDGNLTKSCSASSIVTILENRVIFFQIQAAYNLDYVHDLISFIYRRENFYFITIDKHRSTSATALKTRLAHFENVVISDDSYITWGGVSQVNSMLRGMSYMLSFNSRYRYYINLSDSDLPLWTSDKLTQFLTNAEARGQLGFISYWRPTVDFDGLTIADRAGIRNFSHRPDVILSADVGLAEYFCDFSRSPIVAAALRPLLVCGEQPVVKTLHIRPPMPFEMAARKSFFTRNPVYIGRQWLILHASLIQRMLSDPAFVTFYQIFASTFIPDEMLFQSYLINAIREPGIIISDNLRYNGGEPANVSDENISELKACDAAFARKLDIPKSEQLLEMARSMFQPELHEFAVTAAETGSSTERPAQYTMPPVTLPSPLSVADAVVGDSDGVEIGPMWLTRLADRHGTDRGSVHLFRHRYTFLYDLLFAPLRQSEITLLEIGLALGGPETSDGRLDRLVDSPSVRMWIDYFPRATVIGYDISDFSHIDHPRFRFVRGDLSNQMDYENLRAVTPAFDIIIDDGSHASGHQQLAFRNLFEHLSPGGLYVIEDLNWQSPVYESQQKVPKTAEFLISYFEQGTYLENEILSAEFMASIKDQVEVFSYFPDFNGQSPEPKLAVLRKRGAATHKAGEPRGSVESAIPNVCRSFDLFDTLMSRRCVTAGRIFDEIQRVCGVSDFVIQRYDAERVCFEAGEYTLDSIYESLAQRLGLSEAEADRIKMIELHIEAANFIPIREHCAEFSEGDIVVSDMYLPRPLVEDALRRVCGINAAPLYLSSHGKRSGRIWLKIQQHRHVREHLGDDPVTDESSAREAGIEARLTTVARRTVTETQLADLGFVGLSEWVREARLATWHADPLLRRAQRAQIEANLPLLFFATAHLLQAAKAHRCKRILFSGRDCYLWEHLYQQLEKAIPGGPMATYFHSSRPTRAKPSRGYLEYFNFLRNGETTLVADLCGTGWSLSRLIEQAGGPRTEIFLLHHLDVPSLLSAYEQWGTVSGIVPIHSLVHRPAHGRDNDVLEDLNRAPYRLLQDVEDTDAGFRPIFAGQPYHGRAAELFEVHQQAFFFACQKLQHVADTELRTMIERPVIEVFSQIYGRLPGLLEDIDPLLSAKREEEELIWSTLQQR
jgi:SAM-dependent methyltransferase